MKLWTTFGLLAAGSALGCMASGPPLTAQDPGTPANTAGPCAPLIVDRTDLLLGTTVQFTGLPDASQVHDLSSELGLAHVVVTLDEWPDDISRLAALEMVPEESDVIVVIQGYPSSRTAIDAWRLIRGRLRVVLIVQGPPNNPVVLDWLNQMPALERVIGEMELASRAGFERLQRPLSFRRVIS